MNVLFLSSMVLSVTLPQGNAGVDEAHVFAQNDPYGAMMALLGMGIVFTALLLIYIIFSNTPMLFTAAFKDKVKAIVSPKRIHVHPVAVKVTPQKSDLTGEVNAAIAAAIHLYRSELHDYEDTVLTIKKVSRSYSPWSSKIYGIKQFKR
jgi:glutaconyl-CoA/methylmalonyl-CoA decarboxylase subunit delta